MTTEADTLDADLLQGADEIAAFLGKRWNRNKVYIARNRGSLPIRSKEGFGVYAFKAELRAALAAPETLPGPKPQRSGIAPAGVFAPCSRHMLNSDPKT